MSKITLVTGGSRSGKSTFAEKLLEDKDDVLYIATAIVTDKEMEKRVEKHKKSRNQKWDTYEGFKELDKALKEHTNKYIMLECIGTMVTNLMFSENHDFDNMDQTEIQRLSISIRNEINKIILAAKENDKELIIVTNEVGWGLVSEHKLGRIFSDMLGHINQFMASISDEVYLVSCGLPLKLK
ncbi:bifunctional adenosylcobinamide kinase/adenosylcobinamide-phosphate guanylyltransferase [Clostridium thailandense]|uniref:Bifunctional adenosylcobinamide kinase/adenosylcobinamide-phosphate guanylyltransferase n=1 Tax=Clostridium thailandense TaxID=2794346 RepID=A0A949WQ57_9CLOT|nr:bifunctional adenosylcobinamide kinase/adenosylcobinamide-phosphate guanylyltransferase [Clostridium thailandense]MBV7272316.1 bifunctional adenosylcobinamide kinase/adenosylcobinamide-phosphate guanylyltransferase [Clostridium thailandense]MCH5136721.1 bifunctional adenosylcobinamide kinase/adenosylcobinamide-phosphate guanylyltransferase [Clostridiaceae bacterium UIB06]